MSDDRMDDLIIRPLAGGGFELEQGCGSGESAIIHLHPCQVALLAERAGLLPEPDPDLLDRLHARHVARIQALQARLYHLCGLHHDGIVDHYAYGPEVMLHLEAISDLADELVADVAGNTPSVTAALPAPAPCHDKSPAITVTPKRGRPATGKALTDAERQARHRQKQAELVLMPADSTMKES